MPELMHVVSLQQAGGVETHFAAFVRQAALSRSGWSHRWLNPERGMHPLIRDGLGPVALQESREKYAWGLKLPSFPGWLRTVHCRRVLRSGSTQLILIWNRSSRSGSVVAAAGSIPWAYWEHGSAGVEGHEDDRRHFFAQVPVALANSRAAARMLQLRWNYAGPVHVCRNALRPALHPGQPRPKPFPRRPVRLGFAGRLVAVKGPILLLHALGRIRDSLPDAELHVAGDGPERNRLQEWAGRLGVSSAVHFHGVTRDMAAFYDQVDCLLHPALREPFGLVAIEAAAHGCPVVAAAVDGLPEAVSPTSGGCCLVPRLSLPDYAALGGNLEGLPRLVYDPVADAIGPPRAVDPGEIAQRVVALFSEAGAYERASLQATTHVLQAFDFDRHVSDVFAVLDGLASRREDRP